MSFEVAQERRKNTGRNDVCPCGSGKKYKKCHHAEDEAAVSAELKRLEVLAEAELAVATAAAEDAGEEIEAGLAKAAAGRKGPKAVTPQRQRGPRPSATSGKSQTLPRRGAV